MAVELKEWLQFGLDTYKTIYKTAPDCRRAPEDRMEVITDWDDPKLSEKLDYYLSWMAYYDRENLRWSTVSKLLDNKYEDEYAKLLLEMEDEKPATRAARIRIELGALQQAITITSSKAETFKADSKFANGMRANVSRRLSEKISEAQNHRG